MEKNDDLTNVFNDDGGAALLLEQLRGNGSSPTKLYKKWFKKMGKLLLVDIGMKKEFDKNKVIYRERIGGNTHNEIKSSIKKFVKFANGLNSASDEEVIFQLHELIAFYNYLVTEILGRLLQSAGGGRKRRMTRRFPSAGDGGRKRRMTRTDRWWKKR